MTSSAAPKLLSLTARITAAYAGNNWIRAEALPGLIEAVYHSLATADVHPAPPAIVQAPAVPIKRSVFPDYIVCLEDGRKLKMLKRHLMTSFGMTPTEYRNKWGLPPDYPMAAPNYAIYRAALAKGAGLGKKPSSDTDE